MKGLHMRIICLIFVLAVASPVDAATVTCTIDGTGAAPKVTFGKAGDCTFTGSNGRYALLTRSEPKYLQASCWRDGGGGDEVPCTIGLVRHSENKKLFEVFAYDSPGGSVGATKKAWISLTYTN